MTFEEGIKESMSKLSVEKELWIIEELKPFFVYDANRGIATLKEYYKFKSQEIKDYKQKVKDTLRMFIKEDGIITFDPKIGLLADIEKELGLE